MADQVRVFVSHHHSPEEDAFTDRLVADLETAGADVWVDDARITSDDFIKKINEGLTGRQWLVLVMTPDALRSPWVQREVNAALNEHTAGRMLGVLPLVVQPCQEQDIPVLWRTLHRYGATNGYEAARGRLFAALGLTPGRSAPPVLPSPPAHTAPPDRFPPLLAELGYRVAFLNGSEVILPPLCDVPAGPFLMGSDLQRDKVLMPNEHPQHWVNLQAFRIGKYPVTVAEYACFVRATGRPSPTAMYKTPWRVDWQTQLDERLEHPVVRVTWDDATAYTTWITERTGQPWRLPTEEEWEKAARWDVTIGVSRVYPWGNEFDQTLCNTREGMKLTTTSIGAYPNGASPCGALDMAGNVFEWTSSLFARYQYSATDTREQAKSTGVRALRGGSWASRSEDVRTASRRYGAVDIGQNDIRFQHLSLYGFRLACSVPYS